MPGQALQPPTSGAGPAIQSWLLSPCPHVVLSRVAVASRQGGSVLCPQPVGDVRGACSTGLQGCGSAPSPSPASEMDAEGVPEPRGPAPAGPERTRCLCQLSLPWLGSPARTRRLHSEKGPRGGRAPLRSSAAQTLLHLRCLPVQWGRLWESAEVTAEQLTWFASLVCLRVVRVAPLFSP